MKRRDLIQWMPVAALGSSALGLALPAAAQGAFKPVEGRDYQRLDKPAPVSVPAGKVEVLEFFGYWCPHCAAFDPEISAWAKRLPADKVVFRRVPVSFRPSQEPMARLYLGLEASGQVEAIHPKVFQALHIDKKPLNTDEEVLAWAKSAGADIAKLGDMMKSFVVATKLRQGRQLAEAYGLDSVPLLGVHGRWRTSPSMAGNGGRSLATVDALAAQVLAKG